METEKQDFPSESGPKAAGEGSRACSGPSPPALAATAARTPGPPCASRPAPRTWSLWAAMPPLPTAGNGDAGEEEIAFLFLVHRHGTTRPGL